MENNDIMMNFKSKTAVRDLDPTNDICFLRLRTKKNEILLAPGIILLLLSLICIDENGAYFFQMETSASL